MCKICHFTFPRQRAARLRRICLGRIGTPHRCRLPAGGELPIVPSTRAIFAVFLAPRIKGSENRMTVFRRVVVMAFALVAATPSFSQAVKIGELNSYKVFPAFLEPYKKGMELALAEVNAAGGVQGHPLEIVSRDDNGTPGDAVRVAEELVSREKVVLLMGTYASNVGLAVAD